MAFRVPTFNLAVSIWRVGGTGGSYAAPDVGTTGNLSPGKRVMLGEVGGWQVSKSIIANELLLPKLTDIRSFYNATNPDLVEVPAGSKRFYQVLDVADIGKGFANEHRIAFLAYETAGNTSLAGGPFPAPVPLP